MGKSLKLKPDPEHWKCSCFHKTRWSLDWKRPITCPDYNADGCKQTEEWWAQQVCEIAKEYS